MPSPRRSWTPLVTLAVALGLTFAAPPPSLAAGAPEAAPGPGGAEPSGAEPSASPEPSAPAPRAGIRIDTSGLSGSDAAIGDKLRERAAALLSERGFEAVEDPADPVIVVVVEASGSEEQPGFLVGTSVERAGEVVPGSAGQLECSLCTRTELLERIEAELPGLLDRAGEHQVAVAPTDPEPGPNPAPATPIDRGGPLGPLGYTGVGLAVVGLAGVGVGAGLIAKGVEPLADRPAYQTNYRTPGFVALGIGGAVVIAGVVALAVDVSKRKRSRRSPPPGPGAAARIEPRGLGFGF